MNSIEKDFWIGKKVLITGHTGFKGSWLSLILKKFNAKVFGLALPSLSKSDLFQIANVGDNVDNKFIDIRNYKDVLNTISEIEPEIIIHMAAQSLVRTSYNNPLETYSTNVMGTLHILQSAMKVGSIKVIINVTSDKCYENIEEDKLYKETDTIGGFDPYSSSKGCSEIITKSFRDSFCKEDKMAIASARSGNVIGGGDWSKDRLIPDIIRGFEKKSSATIRNPDSIRPWQHVLDPLSGYLLLAQKLYNDKKKYSGAWNFGPKEESLKEVKWVANYIKDLWSNDVSWKIDKNVHPHEAKTLKLDCAKANNILGWEPRLSLKDTLYMAVDWYKAYLKNKDMLAFTLKQIEEYKF